MELKTDFEKKSALWLGSLIIVMSLIYIFTTLGRVEWTAYIAIVFGFFLSAFLFVEGGITEYFRKKDYKSIGFGDFVVFLTTGSAIIVFLNTILLFQTIKDNAPEWLLTFTATTGVTAGVIAGILGIVYVFTSRFK